MHSQLCSNLGTPFDNNRHILHVHLSISKLMIPICNRIQNDVIDLPLLLLYGRAEALHPV